jgi:hypothetical protein
MFLREPSVGDEAWRAAYEVSPERDATFTTLSGEPVRPLYTQDDTGRYPFTRGVYPSMYRGRLWTMRQFAGFGTAEETNERFRYLLEHGQTGSRTAFDMPSLMGHDSDSPRSLGEVGREGVAIDTLDDMQTLFAGIDLGEVSVSMTINAPAAIMLAFYVVAAEHRSGGPAGASGRHDPGRHPQGVHRPEGVVLPDRPGDAPVGDMIEWCSRRCRAGTRSRSAATTSARPARPPRRSSRSRSRTASPTSSRRSSGASTSTTSRRGCLLLQRPDRLLRGDRQVPRRAAHLGARAARDLRRQDPRSWLMRFHTQTAGVSLTAQQPLNNIVRTAIEALAGVLGGTQSLHTNSYDEALALPTEEAVTDRAAHPADHRPRDRRRQHDRPARRQLLRRGAHRRDRGEGLRVLPRSTSSAAWSRRSSATTRSARSPTPPSRCSRRSTPASASSSASTATPRDERADPHAADRPALERKQIDRLAGGARAPRRRRRRGVAGGAARGRAQARAQPDGAAAVARARARLRGRDRAGAAGRSGATTPRRPVF